MTVRPRKIYSMGDIVRETGITQRNIIHPIAVIVEETGSRARARLEEADLEAEGKTARQSVIGLREAMVHTFVVLSHEAPESGEDADQLATLSALIRRRKVRATGRKL